MGLCSIELLLFVGRELVTSIHFALYSKEDKTTDLSEPQFLESDTTPTPTKGFAHVYNHNVKLVNA